MDNEKITYTVVNQSKDAENAVRDMAKEQQIEWSKTGNKFEQTMKGVWNGVAGTVMESRRRSTLRKTATAEGNAYVNLSEDDAERARNVTLERFSRNDKSYIHEAAGESIVEDKELIDGIKDVLKNNLDDNGDVSNMDKFEEEQARFLSEYGKSHQSDKMLNKDLVTVDNFQQIQSLIKAAVSHQNGINNVVDNMDIVVGESRSGARTELNSDLADKIIDRFDRNKILQCVNPEAVAVATGIVGSALKFGSRRVAGAVAMTVAPGVVSGVWAGVDKNARMKQERVLHMREMANGGEISKGSKIRNELEKTRYQAVEAKTMIDSVNEIAEKTSSGQVESGKDLSDMIARVSVVKARIDMCDQEKIDLITYSKGKIDEERLVLDEALKNATSVLEQRLNGGLDETTKEYIEQHDDIKAEDMSVKDISDVYQRRFADFINRDRDSKDKEFNKLKRREVIKAMGRTALLSVSVGLVAQEIEAGFDNTRQGLVETIFQKDPTKLVNGEQHQTILSSLANHNKPYQMPDASEHLVSSLNNSGSLYNINGGYQLEPNGGHLELLDATHKIVSSDIPVDSNGAFTKEGLAILNAHHLEISGDKIINNTVTKNVGVEDYMNSHQSELTHIKRSVWFDNGSSTRGTNNQVELGWGGHWNDGVTAEGNYQMSIKGMLDGSSVHSGVASGLKDGTLKLAVSASKDSQSHVFMLDVNQDGTINIPANSPVGQLFTNENGHAVFNGAYAEVVKETGLNQDGAMNVQIFGTEVGHNTIKNLSENVVNTTHEYVISKIPEITAETPTYVDMAPIMPIVSRRSMEVLASKKDRNGNSISPNLEHVANAEGGYGEDYNEKQKRIWREQRSPRLLENPNIDLNTSEELNWYYKDMYKREGAEYINRINHNIDQSSELKNLNPNTRAMVVMPVAAIAEADNIYHTLSLYADQQRTATIEEPDGQMKIVDTSPFDKTTIVLNVNWIDDAVKKDPNAADKIKKTLSEIERAKKDFPWLNVASFTRVYSQEWVNDHDGKLFGRVIKELYDTATFAARRKINSGEIKTNQEMMLITNDADAQGIPNRYFENYIRELDERPDADVFTSPIRWGIKEAQNYPGYMVTSSFFSLLDMLSARRENREKGSVASCGPNSGFRLSAYAAGGGCNGEMGAGADSELGQRIKEARGASVISGSYGNSNNGSNNDGQSKSTSTRTVNVLAKGTTIDTAPDRLLKTYKEGKSLSTAWNNFDSNGYRPRSVESDGSAKEAYAVSGNKEDPTKDIDAISERVATSVRGFANDWYKTNTMIGSAIRLWFGPSKNYDMRWENDRFYFDFTADGKKWLQRRLQSYGHLGSNSKKKNGGYAHPGRKLSYGGFLNKKFYGDVKMAGESLRGGKAQLIS
jgi:hypothetical protein